MIVENRHVMENPPVTSTQLLQKLDAMDIGYELHHHEPVFTVAESEHLSETIDGVDCRNLFLRDKKKVMFLVVAAHETKIDLKKLQEVLQCGRLSFGSKERLWENLGVRPGSVCPFAVINDSNNNIGVVIDKVIMDAPIMNCHPLENDKTVSVDPQDLVRFLEACKHVPLVLDMKALAPDESKS